MYMARKISRAKWDAKRNIKRGLREAEVSADAVTGDLRTRENTLSFWRCPTEANGDIENAALAIAAAGDRLDKLDIVWLADSELLTDGHTLKETEGRTPVTDLAKRHVDICELDYVRLGKVALRVAAAVGNERCRCLTKNHVRRLLITAIQRERISLEELSDGLQAEIKQ